MYFLLPKKERTTEKIYEIDQLILDPELVEEIRKAKEGAAK